MEELIMRYPMLKSCMDSIIAAKDIMINSFENGGQLLVCGNGGSSADSDHIVGELMKGFMLKREIPNSFRDELKEFFPDSADYIADNLQGAVPAISLTSQSGLISAFANDVKPDMVYAQQVYGYGKLNDVFIGISTSGNSKNVVNAAMVAKAGGLFVIGMTGEKECQLDKIADVVIHVPETETFKVQELHLPVYHYLCAECERQLFS